ncbi:hypothetical protein ACFVRR_18875 [Gottfriedia sp. NPDC057948]|uniref:hypothetical protein n=1 Tax=Gottfriedia sp. NPDC057948 TaxID=3346287 RepID=UPI0036DDC477
MKRSILICNQLAGTERANKIRQIDLKDYIKELKMGLEQSIKIAIELDSKAIYFEYDLDHNWEGAFYICEEYNSLEECDEDWACNWTDDFGGPSFKQFAEIYEENGFDRSNLAIGTTIYLVARTVISCIRALNELPNQITIPLSIAFHDQDPILLKLKFYVLCLHTGALITISMLISIFQNL